MSKRDAALIAPRLALHFAPVPLSHTAYERPIGAPVARRPNFPLFDKGAAAFGHRRRTLSPGSNVEYFRQQGLLLSGLALVVPVAIGLVMLRVPRPGR